MQRAAIYARVSSEKQEQERTIESQVAALREACKQAEVEVIGVYADDGISGTTLARPALDKLRDDAARRVFESVYILSPDRLARKYLYQAIVLDELRKRQVQVMFLDKPVTERPEDQLLLGMQGLIAEYERAQIIERTRRGKLFKARSGEIQTTFPLFGYSVVRRSGSTPTHYVVDEAQAAVVRLIFSLYVRLRSTLRISQELHRRGIRSPRGSERWSPGNLNRMLRCEAYVGVAYYNKLQGQGRLRPRSEWIAIKVPAIVNEEVFALTQRLLDQNGGCKPRLFYLLSRIVYCAKCGHLYVGDSGGRKRKRKHRYYRCAFARTSYPRMRGCDSQTVYADSLEEAVLAAFRRAVARPEFVTRLIVERGEIRATESATSDALRKRDMLEAKKQRLLDLYLDGALPKEEFVSRRQALAVAVDEIDRQAGHPLEPAGVGAPTDLRARVGAYCDRASNMLQAADSVEIQHCLRLLVDRVVYDSERGIAEVQAHIPSSALLASGRDETQEVETLANSASVPSFAIAAKVQRVKNFGRYRRGSEQPA